MGVVVLAAVVGGGAKDYHITRAPPPTTALSYGGQALGDILAERRGHDSGLWSEISTHCKRGFITDNRNRLRYDNILTDTVIL